MKRKILFRGNSNNNEWVYGDLRHFSTGYGIAAIEQLFANIRVKPETIGQYTGLKDKNGKEIYEGDLLEVANHKRDKECIADVIFIDGAFWLHFPNEDLLNIKEVSECWGVIGNVHDNPEMKKGGER